MDSLPNSMDSVSSYSFNPNKHLKEEFVSNLTGTSLLEIFALSITIPLFFLLRHSIPVCSNSNTVKKKDDDDVAAFSSSSSSSSSCASSKSKSLWAHMTTITVDFLFILLPMLLSFTVLAEYSCGSALLLTVLVFSVTAKRSVSSAWYQTGPIPLSKSITSYRVLVMFVTFLCILAVDFRIFPRRYAKTETYGTGLMDLGVGSYIVANSLVSPQARRISSIKEKPYGLLLITFHLTAFCCVVLNWIHDVLPSGMVPSKLNLRAAIRSTGPLLLLGFGRLLSTRSVDYQVHTAEYGVHWNFFFTLAAVSILTSLINIQPQYSGVLGFLILIGYQSWLSNGLNVYLLSDERGTDIFSKNKEGIYSILGYWGMYLVGVQLGYSLFFGNHSSGTLRNNNWARIRVSILSVMFWLITVFLDRHIERVSRRMCNLTYVTFVLAENLQVLAILMHSDCIAGSKISALEEAFNSNLLGSFLLSNVITGLVNLCVDTLFAPSHSALLILILYAYVLSVIFGVAAFYGVRLKFW